MRRSAAILAAAALAGCAVPTTGVVPQNEGMYTITRQGNGFWVTTESLKTAAVKEAADFCTAKGAQLKVIHSKDIPAGALGRWPESEILFQCV